MKLKREIDAPLRVCRADAEHGRVSAQRGGTMECEIKLAIDAAGAIRLKKSPVLRAHAVSKPEEREHVDRYFDMPGLTLWKHGFALRVRTDGAQHVQTLKGGGSAL